MWTGLLVTAFILYILWKISKAILKPIFDFIYYGILDLFMGIGLSERAAKALISVIIIFIIWKIVT